MEDYTKLKAKKTFYNGIEFKSNLEARIAEGLDKKGIQYEYEPCCFRSPNYEWGQYTPDFYLPTIKAYVEVAGVWDERHYKNFTALKNELECSNTHILGINSDGYLGEPKMADDGEIIFEKSKNLNSILSSFSSKDKETKKDEENKTLETATGAQQPKKPTKELKSVKMNILITPSIKAGLDEIAGYNQISRNELINVLLRDYIDGKLEPREDEINPRDIPLYHVAEILD